MTFAWLEEINARPAVWSADTAADLWTDPHISKQMLSYHLNDAVDLASRRTGFIKQSVEFIVDRFGVGEGTTVADFGCGPGFYTTRLAATGAVVTGIDFSEGSIRYARDLAAREGVNVEHVHTDYTEYETTARFDLVIMIMCDFAVLDPERRRKLLTKFYSFLEPGGAVLLDVGSLPAYAEREESVNFAPGLMEGFWSADPYFGFLNTFKYDAEHVVLDKYTIVEAKRSRTIYNWFQYFDRGGLAQEFSTAGFEVEAILGDVAGADYDPNGLELAVIAQKPLHIS